MVEFIEITENYVKFSEIMDKSKNLLWTLKELQDKRINYEEFLKFREMNL